MNKPLLPPVADDDIGPLNEHGQQVWSPKEEQAIARMHGDPEYWAGIAEAEADIAAGRMISHEELARRSAERSRRWRAERGL